MSKPLADRLAEFATTLKFEDLQKDVVHEVKRRVLDSIGCALGAWHAEPSEISRKVVAQFSAKPGATIWGTTHVAPPDWAAFVNGAMVRHLDYNDTYLSKEPAHPSDNIPAILAAAEASGANGREVIAAIAIAYEIQCRLCDAASLRAIGWDHVTYGCFSSAAGASRVMKLDAGRTRHALGIAGVASAALRQSRVGELSDWKGCAFANAARHGVYATLLAGAGITGPAPIFEGEKGFQKLVSGPLTLAGPIVGENDDLMMLRTMIKCWPVEYHAQSAVEASLELRTQIPDVSQVEAVVVDSHDAAVDIIGSEPEKWRPKTRETADHSLPYIVAAALVDGEVTAKQFDPARFTEPKLIEFVQRVTVRRHAELSALYPKGVGNLIAIRLKGGKVISKRVDYPCGHALNRMSDERVAQKFHLQADPLIGAQKAEAVRQWVDRLDSHENVTGLAPLLVVK